MRIGIDARLISETGIGRYIRNILTELSTLDRDHEYIIYLSDSTKANLVPNDSRFLIRNFRSHWHTIEEQCLGPYIFGKDRLDLLHIPYVTIPVFYTGKTVVTIHDLTLLSEKTGKASTLPRPLYELKHQALRTVLSLGLQRATGVICVSHATDDAVIQHYPFLKGKTTVIYEGVDEKLQAIAPSTADRSMIPSPYFLCVGNAYPHKNLDMLIGAFSTWKANNPSSSDVLVFVGPDDYFYRLLQKKYAHMIDDHTIMIIHSVSDQMLVSLYAHARCLVFPSTSEGFGLPALEAGAAGIPLFVSDIPVFREIVGEIATFLPPNDPSAWTAAFSQSKSFVRIPDAKRKTLLDRFSWEKAALLTADFYEHCA
jgi:glycosyltransferase involved in cell wall biosynthesis